MKYTSKAIHYDALHYIVTVLFPCFGNKILLYTVNRYACMDPNYISIAINYFITPLIIIKMKILLKDVGTRCRHNLLSFSFVRCRWSE